MTLRVSLIAILLLVFVAALPQSAAFAQEPAEPVCIQCHSQLPEKYSQPARLWQGSVPDRPGAALL